MVETHLCSNIQYFMLSINVFCHFAVCNINFVISIKPEEMSAF